MSDHGPASVRTGQADTVHESTTTKAAGTASPRSISPRGLYGKHRSRVNTVLSIALGLAIWEIAAYHVSALIIVPLQDIWDAFVQGVSNGTLGADVWATSEAFLIAFVMSAVAGIVIGLIMATSNIANEFLDPWVSALYATPLIVVAPLFIAIFGLGLQAKIAVAFILAVLPVIINTSAGIRTVDLHLIEGAHSFGATRLQIFYKVLIPGAVPFIITGLRLAVGRALIGVVVAEFFGSQYGLGHRVFISAQNFDTADVFVGMFILMGMGVVLFKFMYWLEKKIAPWREFKVP